MVNDWCKFKPVQKKNKKTAATDNKLFDETRNIFLNYNVINRLFFFVCSRSSSGENTDSVKPSLNRLLSYRKNYSSKRWQTERKLRRKKNKTMVPFLERKKTRAIVEFLYVSDRKEKKKQTSKKEAERKTKRRVVMFAP